MKFFFRKGFTMLELSMVITLIGLLLFGVFTAGQYAKRSMIINQIVDQFGVLTSATYQFYQKYNAWPGDYNGYNDASLDGNGNGYIDVPTGGGTAESGNERVRAFRQLSKEGLIQGQYTGTWSGTVNEPAGNYAPKGPIKNSIFMFGSASLISSGYVNPNMIVLRFSKYGEFPVLTPKEAQLIDFKLDDGKPDLGKVIPAFGLPQPYQCAANTGEGTSYQTQYNLQICTINYIFNPFS